MKMSRSTSKILFAALGLAGVTLADKVLPPPRTEQLFGAWVGYDGGSFYRIRLAEHVWCKGIAHEMMWAWKQSRLKATEQLV